MPQEIISSWRFLVNENEFATKIISAIKIRNGMDESTLQSHIAYSAGQPKKQQYMTGAKTLIDILRASQLIKEKDGKFIISKDEDAQELYLEQKEIEPREKPITIVNPQPREIASGSPPRDGAQTQLKININVSVDCSVDELDKLGEKIKEIMEKVNYGEDPIDGSED